MPAFWRRFCGLDRTDPLVDWPLAQWVRRFSQHSNTVLTTALAGSGLADHPAWPLDPQKLAMDRRYTKLLLKVQTQVLAEIQDLQPIVLKGMGTAARYYPSIEARGPSDLDLLLSPTALDALIARFEPRGFRFHLPPAGRFGAIVAGSMPPFVSPDGLCNLDLHVEAEAWPASRGLDCASITARAESLAVPDGPVLKVPTREDAFALAAANLGRDKFYGSSLRKLIDLARMLADPQPVAWREVEMRARRGGYLRPLRVALRLISDMHIPIAADPPSRLLRPFDWPGESIYRGVRDDWYRLTLDRAGPLWTLLQEWCLGGDVTTAVTRVQRRGLSLAGGTSAVPAKWHHLVEVAPTNLHRQSS